MTDERSGLSGTEREAAAPERPGAEPDDRHPTAGCTWSSDCGSDCGCLDDRGSRSEGRGRASKGRAASSAAARANDFTEAWKSMLTAMAPMMLFGGRRHWMGWYTDRTSPRFDNRPETAREILDRPYASGDITKESYQAMIVDLDARAVAR